MLENLSPFRAIKEICDSIFILISFSSMPVIIFLARNWIINLRSTEREDDFPWKNHLPPFFACSILRRRKNLTRLCKYFLYNLKFNNLFLCALSPRQSLSRRSIYWYSRNWFRISCLAVVAFETLSSYALNFYVSESQRLEKLIIPVHKEITAWERKKRNNDSCLS